MAKKNRNYWRDRAEEHKKIVDKDTEQIIRETREAYERSLHHIDGEIARWYQRFADAEEITVEEARRRMNAGELNRYRMTLEEYIARGEQLDLDSSWATALEKASALHHIDRYDALRTIIRAEIEELKAKTRGTSWMDMIAEDAYNHMIYALSREMGLAIGFNQPAIDRLKMLIKQPWAPDGIDFARRVDMNMDKLAAEITKKLQQAFVTGQPYRELAADIEKTVGLKAYEAERIIRTESTQISSHAEQAAYNTAGIEQYEILVTLDDRTCELCGLMDKAVEDVEKMEPGVNAPPFHPNCRCTTVGHYDDGIDETRIARDESGKNIYVQADMTWEEWKAAYGNEAEGLAAKANVGGVKKHDPPVLLGKINPHDRSAKMAALEEQERRIADSVIENAIVICKDGSMYQCFGVKDGVWPDEDLGEKLIGAMVTHNHPEGSGHEYTFSNFDVNLFVDCQLETLRGIDEKFVYQMSSVDKRTDPAIDISKITEYDSRSETVRGRLEKMGIGYRRWSRE